MDVGLTNGMGVKMRLNCADMQMHVCVYMCMLLWTAVS